MKPLRITHPAGQILLVAAFMFVVAGLNSAALAQTPPMINVEAKLQPDNAQRGRTVKGTVTMTIPGGYHVHSNRPLEKYLIATALKIDASGVKVGPTIYPRPIIRSLKFSKNKVAVFEGQTTLRFSVTVPRGFTGNSTELKGRLRYQSCSDDLCFPPLTREFSLWLRVE